VCRSHKASRVTDGQKGVAQLTRLFQAFQGHDLAGSNMDDKR
jgi:hypothetical protein